MKLIIHDFDREEFNSTVLNSREDIKIISEDSEIHNCIGCFGCWIKTPAECIIRDKYGDMGEVLSKCDKVVIVSRCFYGGFSPFVKNVLDRSISYLHPYFIRKNGEMHHRQRYNNNFELQVIFYGENITEKEKQTSLKLVKANSINFHCSAHKVYFVKNMKEMGGIAL